MHYGFGGAVELSDNQIIVGDWNKQGSDGSERVGDTYIYEANNGTWTSQSILPSDAKSKEAFGYTISVNGNYMIISSPNFESTGLIYLFKKDSGGNWEKVQKITNDLYQGMFGFSLDITNKYALVGAPSGGSAYLYTIDNDELINPVKLSYGVTSDKFGYAVSLTDEYLFISSAFSNENGNQSGSVHIFKQLNGFWVQHQLLIPKDNSDGDKFGASIEVSGNYLYIGADYDTNESGLKTGSVYIYHNNDGTWEQIQKITESDLPNESRFGFSISSNVNEMAIGAMYMANGITSGTGAVYMYGDTTLDTNNEILSEGLNLYPNPTSNLLSIESKLPLVKVEIFSILGRKEKVLNSEFNSIQINNLSKGFYIIKIYSEKGTTVRKLIKY